MKNNKYVPEFEEGKEVEEKEVKVVKKKEVKAVKKPAKKAVKFIIDCPDCTWKKGLKNANELCPTCEGSGKVVV